MTRGRVVSVRLSEAEYARLKDRAERMGMDLSNFIRRQATHESPTPASGVFSGTTTLGAPAVVFYTPASQSWTA